MAEEETEVTVDEDVTEKWAELIAKELTVMIQTQMDLGTAAGEAADYIWKNAGTTGKVCYVIDAT